MSFNSELENALSQWKIFNRSKQFEDEFKSLVEEQNEEKLKKLFLSRIEFGTAGLRGRMGAGFACMNDVVVIQACQGLLEYLQKTIPDANTKGVVIGYDGRYYSKRFAQLSATIFLNANVKVYLFPDVNPTPFIPFSIKLFKAAAGIMVTASHNPKEDNGYKVYWENSAQIISPHDKGISECIKRNLKPRDTSWKTEIIDGNDKIINPLPEIMDAYVKRLLSLTYDINMNQESNLKFVYTAMHGVGYRYIDYVFEQLKFQSLIPVREQMDPDPEFPTVKFPNPEEGKAALTLSIKTANENNCRIILANDPDADRFSVAEKLKNGSWKIFTGNEIGALLGWWMLENYKMKNPDKKDLSDVYFISSTVSSKILRTIANIEKLSFEETLTGFKWMGNKADDLVKKGKTFLFAFEESIGFMCDIECLDKDGISAAVKVAELSLYIEQENLSLNEKLEQIYSKYGQHLYSSSYYFCYDSELTKKIFSRIRNWTGKENNYPDSLANGKYKITGVRDLTAGFDSDKPDNKPVLPVSKSSQMITFSFENGFICTLRTSGTEPKIKYYSELISSPNDNDVEKLKELSTEMVNILIDELLQPKLNNLIPKSD